MTIPVVIPTVVKVPRCKATIGSLRCTYPEGHAFGHVYHSSGGNVGSETEGAEDE